MLRLPCGCGLWAAAARQKQFAANVQQFTGLCPPYVCTALELPTARLLSAEVSARCVSFLRVERFDIIFEASKFVQQNPFIF